MVPDIAMRANRIPDGAQPVTAWVHGMKSTVKETVWSRFARPVMIPGTAPFAEEVQIAQDAPDTAVGINNRMPDAQYSPGRCFGLYRMRR